MRETGMNHPKRGPDRRPAPEMRPVGRRRQTAADKKSSLLSQKREEGENIMSTIFGLELDFNAEAPHGPQAVVLQAEADLRHTPPAEGAANGLPPVFVMPMAGLKSVRELGERGNRGR